MLMPLLMQLLMGTSMSRRLEPARVSRVQVRCSSHAQVTIMPQ